MATRDTVTLSRADILATLDRMGGVAGIAPLLSLLPGAGGAGASSIIALLQLADKELRAGRIDITIKTLSGQNDIEVV